MHASFFIPTTSSLFKAIKKGFQKTWTSITENFINKHLEKLINTTMGHLHMRIQGLQ